MDDLETKNSIKVVIVGEPGVGKTCITARFVNNMFTPDTKPTPGASYSQKTVNIDKYGMAIKFDIWDTAGQERFRSLNKIFYKDAEVAILVYDITRKSSFEEIKNFWVNQVKENATNPISKLSIYIS